MVVSSEKVRQTHYEETKTDRETNAATTKKYCFDWSLTKGCQKQNPRQELINKLKFN